LRVVAERPPIQTRLSAMQVATREHTGGKEPRGRTLELHAQCALRVASRAKRASFQRCHKVELLRLASKPIRERRYDGGRTPDWARSRVRARLRVRARPREGVDAHHSFEWALSALERAEHELREVP